MTTALILGATGFIGGHVGLAALQRGWELRGLRRDASAVGLLGAERIAWFIGNLDEQGSLEDALRGVDLVFHAAAFYPSDGRRVPSQVAHAVQQMKNVLEALQRAGSPPLVYTSSLSTIGRPPEGEDRLADERDVYVPGTLPRSAYYETKIAMETEVLRAAVVVNPTVVFGPGDARPTTGGLLIALARGFGIVSLPGWLNIVDVRDVAEGHLRAAEAGVRGQRYILGGANLRISEFMRDVARRANVPPPRAEIPAALLRVIVRIGERLPGASVLGNHVGAFEHWQPINCSRAERELGLKPRPLAVTLADSLRWYEEHGALKRRTAVV
ncbi:MAG: NAD-dependent epimerase/dehydratase family protein [Chloroflexi bacterium]|nr:NAD-dependent epimerase/dehydratase family protein [Chloroflexota bacterium]